MHLSQALLTTILTLTTSVVGTPVASASTPSVSHEVLPPTGGTTVILGEIDNTRNTAAGISVDKNTTDVSLEARDGVIGKRSYMKTCNECKIVDEKTLSCFCYTESIIWGMYSLLDLNKCLVNNHGLLQWRKNGGFFDSCIYRGLGDSKVYRADCHTGSRYVFTSINLDERIHNYNGYLGCDAPN